MGQEDEYKSKSSFREKLKTKSYRSKLAHSGWIACLIFGMGLAEGQRGPALPELQLITKTSVEAASKFLTLHSLGFIVGTIVTGLASKSKKVRKNLFIVTGQCMNGAMLLLTPFCTGYAAMMIVNLSGGIFSSISETTANSEYMRLWGTEGRTLVHLLHFVWSMGGTMAPLVTEPFLAKRVHLDHDDASPTDSTHGITAADSENPDLSAWSVRQQMINHTNEHIFNGSTLHQKPISLNGLLYVNESLDNQFVNNSGIKIHTATQEEYRPIRIHYAFVISGTVALLCAVPFIYFLYKERSASSDRQGKASEDKEESDTSRQLPLSAKILLFTSIGCFYFFCNGAEEPFASLLMTFLLREFPEDMDKSKAAYITLVYWCSFSVSRFAMIFISRLLTPVKLLAMCLSLMLVSILGFLASALYGSTIAITITSVVYALGISGVFPGGMAWCESELAPVRGLLSSVIFFFSAMGVMLNPIAVGILMERFSNMWFCYTLLLTVSSSFSMFLVVLSVNRFHLNKAYGKLYPGDQSVDVVASVPQQQQSGEVTESLIEQNGEGNRDALSQRLEDTPV